MGLGPAKSGDGLRRKVLAALIRLAVAAILTSGLSACAIPPIVTIASLAADGVLLATTGKSKADHGLSLATGRDCNTLRVFEDQNVCQDDVVAQIEPIPAEVERELVRLRTPTRMVGLTPRVALAATFQGQGVTAGLKVAQLPHLVSSQEIQLARRHPLPSDIRVAGDGSKAVSVAAMRPVLVAKASLPTKRVIKHRVGSKVAASSGKAKLVSLPAKATAIKSLKVSNVGAAKARAVIPSAAIKVRPALPPVAAKPMSRKVSQLMAPAPNRTVDGVTRADHGGVDHGNAAMALSAVKADGLLQLAMR